MTDINILMTVYNDGDRLLKESINSVLNQTWRDFKFIIVNDGSNDSSHSIINEFQKKDARIVYINRSINKGRVYSLNEGLSHCDGKYIFINDADDISYIDRIEISINYFNNVVDKKNNFGLLGTAYVSNNQNNNTKTTHYLKYGAFKKSKMPMWRLLIGMPYPHSSIMYSKTSLLDIGGFATEVSAGIDYLTLLKIANKYDIYGINQILVQRNIDGNNFFMQSRINSLTGENSKKILDWQKKNISLLLIKKIPYFIYISILNIKNIFSKER